LLSYAAFVAGEGEMAMETVPDLETRKAHGVGC